MAVAKKKQVGNRSIPGVSFSDPLKLSAALAAEKQRQSYYDEIEMRQKIATQSRWLADKDLFPNLPPPSVPTAKTWLTQEVETICALGRAKG